MAIKRVKYGVVGCGHLGRFHAEKISAVKNAKLEGVFDIIPEKTKSASDANKCRACKSIDELLDCVDAVSIVVPTESHFVEAARALNAGKHVLVEKPIATTIPDAQELIQLAGKNKLKLQVGHIERFNPAAEALNLLSEPPRFMEIHRLSQFSPRGLNVAVILELMIHDLDLLLSVIKSSVKEVRASAVAVVSEKPDIANARIEFENGTVANLTASRISANKMRKFRMFAKDNYLSIDFFKRTAEHFVLAKLDETETRSGYLAALKHEPTGRKIMFRQYQYPERDSLTDEIQSFLDAITGDTRVAVGGIDAAKALKLALKIESIAMENFSKMIT